MARMTMQVHLTTNREGVILQLNEEGRALGHIIFDASSAARHINEVALGRSQLIEEVPPDLDPGARLEAIPNPVWRTIEVPEHNSAGLVLRHPGLGWLSFLIPANEARALGQSLAALAEALESKGDPDA